ncbi:hypothetical protein LSTR_LSTR007873 [Laodelphax striatellus]|uniref:Uncharacterized protein n=1 Tax=Laodelphax striatellus TaxID=195883 RepID=A0A482XQ18_LAOST|nr:hypothetical protein LSTR_LSTR007873 [Laodelphax striatellus]
MHSSFKSKHNFNRRNSFNPYSRRSPFLSSSVNHKDQGFDIHLQNRPGPSRSKNSNTDVTHNERDSLPLKLVFSRTINMPSKRIYSNADPNVYFRRKSTEITKQPSPYSETPKNRLPLIDLTQDNTAESSFRGDSFESFRSISGRHDSITSNKENNRVQELEDCFEDLHFTPPWEETCSSVQQQLQPKHMFDFGMGTGREVNRRRQNVSGKLMTSANFGTEVASDSHRQNASENLMTSADFGTEVASGRHRQNASDKLMTSADFGTEMALDRHRQNASDKLMTSADFLVTASSYRCTSPVTSSVSSSRLSIPDIDEDMENSRPNLSPISSETSAVCGSKYNNILEGLELLTCNESGSGAIFSPSPPIYAPHHDSLDQLLDMNLPLSEGFAGCVQNSSYGVNQCVHDKRRQEGYASYFGGSGQDIFNKRCDRRDRGKNRFTRNYDFMGRNYVGRRFRERDSDQNSVNRNNYDGVAQNCFGRRFNERGSVRSSVNSPKNYDGIGQNSVGRRLNYPRSDRNHDGQNFVDGMLNQGSSGPMSINRTEDFGGRVVQISVDRNYNQVCSGRNSVNNSLNHDGIGGGRTERRCNQESSGRNSLNITGNNIVQRIYLEGRCDNRNVMDCDESISLLSNDFYVGANSDGNSEHNSVSSEVVIPQHLLDLWRRSPIQSTTLRLDCLENDHHLSTEILISDDDEDIVEDNVDEHISVINDGSPTLDTTGYGIAISQVRSGDVGSNVNHARWTSKKVSKKVN